MTPWMLTGKLKTAGAIAASSGLTLTAMVGWASATLGSPPQIRGGFAMENKGWSTAIGAWRHADG